MRNVDVVVYTSNHSTPSQEVINQLEHWAVDYTEKNVSEDREVMQELQGMGIFGTPATFIGNEPILGPQINKLKRTLNV